MSFKALRVNDDGSLRSSTLQKIANSPILTTTTMTYIQAAKNPDLLVVGTITGDPMTSAQVVWPDGKPGVLTIVSRHSTGAITSYRITHVDGSTVVTYTQPAITRNSNGAPTNVPQIVVS